MGAPRLLAGSGNWRIAIWQLAGTSWVDVTTWINILLGFFWDHARTFAGGDPSKSPTSHISSKMAPKHQNHVFGGMMCSIPLLFFFRGNLKDGFRFWSFENTKIIFPQNLYFFSFLAKFKKRFFQNIFEILWDFSLKYFLKYFGIFLKYFRSTWNSLLENF